MSITDARLQELIALHVKQRTMHAERNENKAACFVDDIVAALTHYEQLRQQRAAEWRPFATAPRDGRRFLTFTPHLGVRIAKQYVRHGHDEWWSYVDADGRTWKGGSQPTCWQPLPSPPDAAMALQAEDGAGG